MLMDMKAKGLQFCDLGGIDPKVSIGTYRFKSGIAGKGGGDALLLGVYDASTRPLPYFLLRSFLKTRETYHRLVIRGFHFIRSRR